MGFLRYVLWLAASFILLVVWGALSGLVLDVADSLLVHTAGPDTTPVWIAYAAMAFTAFVWPALLQVLVHGKRPLGRMIRSWILAFALLNLLLAGLMLAGVADAGARSAYFGRDLTGVADVLLGAALYAASVAAVELFFRRRGASSLFERLDAGSV